MKTSAIKPWIKPLSERLAKHKKMPGYIKPSNRKISTKKETKND
jgi:hypothetical protein